MEVELYEAWCREFDVLPNWHALSTEESRKWEAIAQLLEHEVEFRCEQVLTDRKQ